MSQLTQGRRVECPFHPDGALIAEWPQPGDYYRHHNGQWFGLTPNGLLAGLANHGVVEHEDATITVSPSILTRSDGNYSDDRIDVSGHDGGAEWHGYLERGVWREV